jgi:hypothetical protein
MATTRVGTRPRDEVDRAVEGMGRAAPRLLALLASEDEGVGRRALDAPVRRLRPPVPHSRGQAPGPARGDTRLRPRVATDLTAIGRQAREPAATTPVSGVLDDGDGSLAEHLPGSPSGPGPAPKRPGFAGGPPDNPPDSTPGPPRCSPGRRGIVRCDFHPRPGHRRRPENLIASGMARGDSSGSRVTSEPRAIGRSPGSGRPGDRIPSTCYREGTNSHHPRRSCPYEFPRCSREPPRSSPRRARSGDRAGRRDRSLMDLNHAPNSKQMSR